MINSLKDFKALVKLCRKHGIDAMEVGDIKFNLGPAPKTSSKRKSKGIDLDMPPEANISIPRFTGEVSPPDVIPTTELSEEDLMFYSATGTSDEQTEG